MSTALPAYRNLLRAARLAFQGDSTMLTAARSSIREGFRVNAALEPSSPEFPAAVKHAEEVATILRQNVVQGKKDGDRYSPCWPTSSIQYHVLTNTQSYEYTRKQNEATTRQSRSLVTVVASVAAVDEGRTGSPLS
ncbi:hypothetical protein FHL15_002683 [Xylaria flabelliformis]|uniref:Mitochondrial zinc maintenance protein 1, mitochondrial n=1 Tax=Xylaria flabelliformis TaxID=2512241 RepID=A0A553I885_9PEZI|nr:hypothetical protein FHL15_002683 [Xylaria flabelliformis]